MISVILPMYNEPLSYIALSVESILLQTIKDFELIAIIDNPSRNDIVSYLKKKNDSRIKIIKNKRNIGLTASLNKGIKEAGGEYIARMDADDISLPNRFEKQLDYLTKNKCGLVGSDIAFMDDKGRVIKEHIVYPRSNDQIAKMLRYNSPIPHPTWFGRAEVFRNNKYVDFPACEDYELLTRLALRGIRMGNVGEVLLKYRINENGISSSKKPVQKTCLEYIRKRYRKGKESDQLCVIAFLNSKIGKRYQKNNKKYFEIIDLANKCKGKKAKIIIALKNAPSLMNRNSVNNIYSAYKSRAIRRYAKKEGG